jgi:hypothetical protein
MLATYRFSYSVETLVSLVIYLGLIYFMPD